LPIEVHAGVFLEALGVREVAAIFLIFVFFVFFLFLLVIIY